MRANVPLLIWGDPGQAKTATVAALGGAWGMATETVVGSIREPSDFLGLPVEVDGRVVYSAPAWALRLAEAPAGLLFLDELTTAAPSVQKAMLRVLQERVVGDAALPSSVAIVAAANPPNVAVDGWDLPSPIANRLMHLDWRLDVDGWLEGVVTDFAHVAYPSLDELLGAGSDTRRVAVRAAVASFLRTRPDLVHKMPTDPVIAGRGWPSPRSWTNAMSVLGELDPADEDAALLVLTGCVGEAAAIEYTAWLAAADLYDPEAVLSDPKIVDWRSRPDRIFALTSALVALARFRADKRTWARALRALTACAAANRPDLAYPGVRTLLQEVPDGASVPDETVAAFRPLMAATGRWAA